MTAATAVQLSQCRRLNCVSSPCAPDSIAGVALNTLNLTPLNALRHPGKEGDSGWFVWGGEYSDRADFFSPLHVSHLNELVPALVPFLALPPGWRVLIAPDQSDQWYDGGLLDV